MKHGPTRDQANGNGDDNALVAPGCACPGCGERRVDSLVWIDDDQVRCARCQTVYNPNQRGPQP